MTTDERIQFFYSVIVSLCWIRRRPVTLSDLKILFEETQFHAMTEKQIRKEIAGLERGGRVAKVPMRRNGRICAGWVISDREELPVEIRDVCQACCSEKSLESFGDERLCLACFKAAKDRGRRVHLSARQEREMSMLLTTMTRIPNENTLG